MIVIKQHNVNDVEQLPIVIVSYANCRYCAKQDVTLTAYNNKQLPYMAMEAAGNAPTYTRVFYILFSTVSLRSRNHSNFNRICFVQIVHSFSVR